jgi:16S rRNA (cytidine1402-2'-O)-methyltransferase
MGSGATVALVSDAGMPLVSDPGFVLVQACVAAGLAVEVLPGPSSALAALVASGLPADRWRFVGFLPRRGRAQREVLAETEETLVAFESPGRLVATLALLAELDAARPAAVCRELTKVHEEIRRGSARELHEHYAANPPRGEVVLVVGAAPPGAARADAALEAARELVAAGARPRAVASVVARLAGVRANDLYRELTGA